MNITISIKPYGAGFRVTHSLDSTIYNDFSTWDEAFAWAQGFKSACHTLTTAAYVFVEGSKP